MKLLTAWLAGVLCCCAYSSTIVATPSPATVGAPILLLWSDDTTDLRWRVFLPRGTLELAGNPVQFTPATPGPYFVSLRTGADVVLSNTVVVVTNSEIDSDNDGVLNESELSLGSNAADSNSKPIVTPQPSSTSFVRSLRINLDSTAQMRDSFLLDMDFDPKTLPESFPLDRKRMALQTAGIVRVFEFVEAGGKISATPVGSADASLKVRRRKDGTLSFKLAVRKANLADALQNHPLGLSEQSVSLTTFFVVGDRVSAAPGLIRVKRSNGKVFVSTTGRRSEM